MGYQDYFFWVHFQFPPIIVPHVPTYVGKLLVLANEIKPSVKLDLALNLLGNALHFYLS
jgi:hypothetical protein